MTSAQIWAIVASLVTGGIGTKVISWLLSRGRLKIDDATALRNELRADMHDQDLRHRGEIDNKNRELAKLETRIATLEAESDKREREFNDTEVAFRMHKVEIYRILVEHGTPREVLDSIRMLDV